MKIKLNRLMITSIWMLSICYYILTMLFYMTDSTTFLKIKSVTGVLMLCIIPLLILLLKKKVYVKFGVHQGILVLCLLVVPIISAVFNSQTINYTLVLNSILWVLLFIVFYYATLFYGEFPINKKYIKISYIAIIILSIPLIHLHLSGLGKVGAVIFSVYGCLTILPLVLYCTERNRRYIPIMITLFLILCTTKRAGILAALIGFIIYYLTEGQKKLSLNKKLFRILTIGILLILGGTFCLFILNIFGVDIIQRFKELSSDGGSGRIFIWSTIISEFQNSDLMHKMFGHGVNAVARQVVIFSDTRIKAHNDIIETLFDYGYIGLTVLSCFLLSLILEWKKQFIQHSNELSVYSYSMIISIILMLLSYYFIESYIINFVAIYWGIVFAERKLKKNTVQSNI